MRIKIIFFIAFVLLIYSCKSNELKEPYKYNYVTTGALTDDCFQVIITTPPDRELKTMADQRENAFIKAKNSIPLETEKQVLSYYTNDKAVNINSIPENILKKLKEIAGAYSKLGTIEQEFYLIDNSAVLIYRIYKTGIKNEILNN